MLTLVGAINIPIIKFSVDWWNTLHQPASVLRLGGPTIHPTILVPLIVMLVAFTLLFVTLHLAAMRNEIMRRRRAHHADDAGRRSGGAVTMDLGPHAAFILTAYAAAIGIVAGLIVWIMLDRRASDPHARRIRGARHHASLGARERGKAVSVTDKTPTTRAPAYGAAG